MILPSYIQNHLILIPFPMWNVFAHAYMAKYQLDVTLNECGAVQKLHKASVHTRLNTLTLQTEFKEEHQATGFHLENRFFLLLIPFRPLHQH